MVVAAAPAGGAAVPGAFVETRAKHDGKVLTLCGQNALVGADDLSSNQELNVVVRALTLVQTLVQISDHGGNFRLGRAYGGQRGKAHSKATEVVVPAVNHNKVARCFHGNPA